MSPIFIHLPVWYFCKGFSFFPRWDMISWLLVIFKGLLIWFLRGFQETKAGDMWMSLKPWAFHRFFSWRTSWIKMLRRFGTNFVLGRSDTQSWVLRNRGGTEELVSELGFDLKISHSWNEKSKWGSDFLWRGRYDCDPGCREWAGLCLHSGRFVKTDGFSWC